MSGKPLRIAIAGIVVAGAVAAVILVNVALLGYAQPRNDPMGKLSPRATLTPAPAPERAIVPELDDHREGHDD